MRFSGKKIIGFVKNVFVIGFISFILLEVLLRLTGSYATYAEKTRGIFTSPYKNCYHSWFHVRISDTTITEQTTDFKHDISTNSYGLRDREPSPKRDSGEFRIIVVGDSFVEGMGTPADSTWPVSMTQWLKHATGKNITLINAGVSGSDIWFGYKLVEQKLYQLKPDLVIHAVNNSDIEDITIRGGKERFLPNGKIQLKPEPFVGKLFTYSRVARFILMDIFDYNWVYLSSSEAKEAEEQALAEIGKAARAYDELGKQHQFTFLLVFHPNRRELEDQKYRANFQRVMDTVRTQGINCYDLNPDLLSALIQRSIDPNSTYWPVDLHHTPEGYWIFGEVMAKYLQDQHFISKDL